MKKNEAEIAKFAASVYWDSTKGDIYIYIHIRTSLHTYDIVYVDYLHIY